MNLAQSIFLGLFGFLIVCIILLIVAPILLRPTPEAKRLLLVVDTKRLERRVVGWHEQFESGLITIIRELRERLGIAVSQRSQDLLYAAGYRSPRASDFFFAAIWLLPLFGIVIGSFAQEGALFWCIALGAGFYLLPNMWLTHRTAKRKEQIRRSLPDIVDLISICVDAGLGLDQALIRVTSELGAEHSEVRQELRRVQLEQSAGRPRLESWKNLAQRTKVQELSIFVSMLTQTERFGTPISTALSQFAQELRIKRRQRAEEAAAKTKVKIVFPLVFCIFPCLFIVLLAPALLSLTHLLNGAMK